MTASQTRNPCEMNSVNGAETLVLHEGFICHSSDFLWLISTAHSLVMMTEHCSSLKAAWLPAMQ